MLNNPTTQEAPGFKRALGLLDGSMVVAGSMIGSGIFIVSADIARNVGGGGWLILVWLITALVTVVAALSYGELAGMFPKAGGQYIYLREAYNPLVGFMYGWTFFTVIQTGTIAAVAVAFAKFTSVFIPELSYKNVLFEAGFIKLSAAQLFAIVIIVLLTIINCFGVKSGKLIQLTFTSTKILALFGLIAVGLYVGLNGEQFSKNLEGFWNTFTTSYNDKTGIQTTTPIEGMAVVAAIGVAMVGSLFSSDAWNNVTFIAGEIKNPKRNIPLSLLIGTFSVSIIYILANVVYIMILPVNGLHDGGEVASRGIMFATDDRVGTAAVSMIAGGTAGVAIMAILIMISTFGCNNGLILSGARVYYAMAKDKLFFRHAGDLNKAGVPAKALIFQGVWACALCLSGTYNDLLDYTIMAALLFYVLTISGLFVLRKKMPDAERPYRAFGYPIVPALYILVAVAIMVDLLIYKSQNSLWCLIIVSLGIPVYFATKQKNKT